MPRPRLPEGFAWLVWPVPEAAAYGSQLRHLLADPEMVALLEAAPQAGRLLRPLCRMLGVDFPPGRVPDPSGEPDPPVSIANPCPPPRTDSPPPLVAQSAPVAANPFVSA